MAVLVTLGAFFGSYTTVLAVIVSLLLWIIFSTPTNTCPFGNHLPKSPPKVVSDNIVSQETTDVHATDTPKKTPKSKKKCGKSCSKKFTVAEKTLKIYYVSLHDVTFNLAQELQTAAEENEFTCTLICLENPFSAEEKLLSNQNGANVFILTSEASGEISHNLKWFADWMFDDGRGKNLLADMKFSLFAVDNSNIFQDWDKRLWRLGAQRLKKAKFSETAEDFDCWKNELIGVLIGKPAKTCCSTNGSKNGCSSDSSCGSDSEDDGTPPPIVDVEDLLLPNK